jgi:glycosyltransferase involved in cell wall biosynthesis
MASGSSTPSAIAKSFDPMTRVAIIFDNFGPYHVARLRAASAVCDLLAIEVAGRSGTYAWKEVSSASEFRRTTLIEKGTSDDVDRVELLQRLEKALDEFQPRVVVVPGWASAAAWGAMRWCLRRRVPMVCMSESTAWDEVRSGWKEWIKRQLVSLFGSALVGGRRHLDYLVVLGLPADRIFSGYDVVDNAYFRNRAEAASSGAADLRRHGQVPPNYFLASARFVEKKNLPRLLDAYALYRNSCRQPKPWSLVLLGDGALRPLLEQKIDSLGLREHVYLPGFKQIDDLPAYYALAGVFVHASTIEPWGLVVNEAMACGLPVLVSDRCGCVEELVQEGINGFRFDPTDPGELARRMGQLSAPDFPLAAFGKQSLSIIALWGPGRFAEGLSAAVQSALAQPTPGPRPLARALLSLLLRR